MDNLKKLALIIDGSTEEGALRAKFHKLYNCSPVFRQGPGNGVKYKIQGYIKGVLPTVKYLLSSDIRMIILIPDLEGRKITPSVFAEKIKTGLIKELVKETEFKSDQLEKSIYVCPPNVMFENWIISDIEGIKLKDELINKTAIQKKYDGKNGTASLDKIMIKKYKKTVHGKILFKATRDTESINNSPSYNNFIIVINKYIDEFCS